MPRKSNYSVPPLIIFSFILEKLISKKYVLSFRPLIRERRKEMKEQKIKCKRRVVHIAKSKVKTKRKSTSQSFHETLKKLNRDFSQLFEDKKKSSDVRLMHRVALNVQHLYFDAKRLRKFPRYHETAEYILLTLTTPWGAPFVLETTLLDAADNFGVQNPKYSDMHKWLNGISLYGHHFPKQILSMVE